MCEKSSGCTLQISVFYCHRSFLFREKEWGVKKGRIVFLMGSSSVFFYIEPSRIIPHYPSATLPGIPLPWTGLLLFHGLVSLLINVITPLPLSLWAAGTLPLGMPDIWWKVLFSHQPQRFPLHPTFSQPLLTQTKQMRSFLFYSVTEQIGLAGPLCAGHSARRAASSVASVKTAGCKLGKQFSENQHIFAWWAMKVNE